MLRLPESLRGAFKDPLGPVFGDAEPLLAAAGDPLIAVGDVVSYHLERADRPPDVAVVDGRTEREAVAPAVERALATDRPELRVENPPGELTAPLLRALREAVAADGPRVVRVDGEEDLAALPAILLAPAGASVVYGQPGEGMVHVAVGPEAAATARDLLSRMDGDVAGALELLDA